jgi:hypothetical protein
VIRRLATDTACGALFIAFWMVAFWMAGAANPVV